MITKTEPFLERLERGPMIGDGAMGTLLFSRLGTSNAAVCFDELNRTQPALVQAVHQDYITAGAQIIETNTFGANRIKLGRHGLADAVRELNKQAVRLAREARDVVGLPIFVAGAIGPSGEQVAAKQGDTHLSTLREIFHEQIDALVEGGADLLMLETFANLVELREAALAAREASDLPIVAQMTFTEDGLTLTGQTPEEVVAQLAAIGVDVIGTNCGMGPAGTLDIVEAMARAVAALPSGTSRPWISAQPNAGLPSRVEGRFLYVSTPEYFGDYARRFADVGVRLIGGCCGTTPVHTASMASALVELAPTSVSFPAVITTAAKRPSHEDDALMPSPGTPTRWQEKLEAGEFAVSVELDPPKGLNPAKVLAGAEMLRSHGIEFINIADSPTARVRMSCISLARLLHDMLDIEPILHFTTRDRNLMALQSDLLGAHALGLRNILALTGDPLRSGEYPNLTGVWNVDSVGLVKALRGMNEGHDAGGSPLGGSACFYIGAALDVNVADTPIDIMIERARSKVGATGAESMTEQDLEFGRFAEKVEAGAQYIMTQFIYDLEPLRQFYATRGKPDIPIILGIQPLYSYKQAEFLHNEIRGVTIPLEVRERMRDSGDRAREVGLEIAYDLISTARDEGLIQGCYLMPSFGRYDLMGDLASSLLKR